MKLRIALIDTDGNIKQTVEFPSDQYPSQPTMLNDIPFDLEVLGRRYLFLSFAESGVGNLTLSVRNKPLLGHKGFYANVAEFEAYVDVKRLPASFLYRANDALFIKVSLEAEKHPQ